MKFTLSLTLLFFCTSLFCQTQKGDWLFRNSTNFSSSETKRESSSSLIQSTDFQIDQSIGYFITAKWLIGTNLNYRISDIEFDSRDFRFTSFQFSPFVRFYFNSGRNQWFAFSKLGFSNSKNKNLLTDKTTTTSGTSEVDLGIGWNRFITRNIALEAQLFFHHNSFSQGFQGGSFVNSRTTNAMRANLSLQFFLNKHPFEFIENIQSSYFRKGNFYTTASAGINYHFSDEMKNFGFSPNLQYFVKDNLELGTSLRFSYLNTPDFRRKDLDFGWISNGRYYFNLRKNLWLGLGLKLGVERFNDKLFNFSGDLFIQEKIWEYTAAPNTHLLYFLGKRTIFRMEVDWSFKYAEISFKEEQNSIKRRSNKIFDGGWRAGLEYFLTTNISILASIDNQFSTTKFNDSDNIINPIDVYQSTGVDLTFRLFIRNRRPKE